MPNLILFNGKLHTQDEGFPNASAIALRDGQILAVGTDAEMLVLANAKTEKIDLQGRRVLPGLTDAHIHFYEWALLLLGLTLDDVRSLDEVQNRVREAAIAAKPGEWIVGQGWNQDSWDQPKMPDKTDLDAIAPDNPVILWRKDLHLAWVNSRALEAAGINVSTPDPNMGVIQRDEKGAPNGLLNELAINLVRAVMPVASDALLDAAMRKTMTRLHKLGITGVHDFRIMGGEDGPPALRAWQRLRNTNTLKLRAWVLLPGELLDYAVALGLYTGMGDDLLRIGGIKLFSDGATGPRTSWMLEPYEDGGLGMPLTPMSEMAEKIVKAEAAGIRTTIHAIGDRAIRELLDVYSEVLEKDSDAGGSRPRHRIEHMQHSHPDDLTRLAPLGLVASVQPLHLPEDMDMVNAALGERARWTYAFRDLLDAGTTLAFGSDCPVVSPNPFLGIQAAVTRQRDDGTPAEGWYPFQRLTVAEAVWGYTMGAAQAIGQDARQGSLSPGKLADLVVLEDDIFTIPALKIGKTKVHMTIFNGDVVYKR
ncbi:MAG: amidohydrolase [Anaerolineae bacterium]|jgi:predicted amidohydrolase YtcJ|nr:amidohydrolase [Anaerolineae bacterium]MBT7069350.1 amidohydrolase [Anaerolineae bacterium]MBT7326532.1 amidohydrolase [Anaerolineae bacterium]MBT7599739.1 amidohydrolase [Anaerolineae bacterium]